jgi:hypothetical protein
MRHIDNIKLRNQEVYSPSDEIFFTMVLQPPVGQGLLIIEHS